MRLARPAWGFTLIEVMVVLSLLAIMAQGCALSLGALASRDADRAVEALRARLAFAAERAWVRGQPLAFERTAEGYRFLARVGDGHWQAITDSGVLAERPLPAGLMWHALELDGRPVSGEALLVFTQRMPVFRLALTDTEGKQRMIAGNGGSFELASQAFAK